MAERTSDPDAERILIPIGPESGPLPAPATV